MNAHLIIKSKYDFTPQMTDGADPLCCDVLMYRQYKVAIARAHEGCYLGTIGKDGDNPMHFIFVVQEIRISNEKGSVRGPTVPRSPQQSTDFAIHTPPPQYRYKLYVDREGAMVQVINTMSIHISAEDTVHGDPSSNAFVRIQLDRMTVAGKYQVRE